MPAIKAIDVKFKKIIKQSSCHQEMIVNKTGLLLIRITQKVSVNRLKRRLIKCVSHRRKKKPVIRQGENLPGIPGSIPISQTTCGR